MKYENFEQLVELVRSAKIRMMTIDSNVIRECGYRFDVGLLGQLQQFKNSNFEFLLSEIVLREIQRQISEKNAALLQSWRKVSNLLRSFDETEEATVRLEECILELDLNANAEQQINQFLLNTSAKVVSADHAEMFDVLSLYFDRRSPFGKGDKKSEFPDAIALLGLENWCRAGNCGMIVVSRDADWIRFCQESDSPMFVVECIEKALEIVNESEQERSGRSLARKQNLITRWLSGEFQFEAERQLKEKLLEHSIPIGTSDITYKAEIVRVEIGVSTISDPAPLRNDDSMFVMMFNLHTQCNFWAKFEFTSPKSEKCLGSGVYGLERPVDSLVLLTATDESTEIEVLLKTEDFPIQFGEVEPDIDGVVSHVPR